MATCTDKGQPIKVPGSDHPICAYYAIPIGGERFANAVWGYEAPFDAVAAIRGQLAFHPGRVDANEERPAA